MGQEQQRASQESPVTFESFQAAEDELSRMKSEGEAGDGWGIVPRGKRWEIAPAAGANTGKTNETSSQPQAEKFYRVTFNERSDVNDPEDVTLAVNGDVVQIMRGVMVALPYRFLEAADHTLYPRYQQEPGKERKITGWVRRFPYVNHGEAKPEDFRVQITEGTKKVREMLERQAKGE